MLIDTRTKSRAYMKAPKPGPMEGTPLLRLFLPRPGFTRYLMQRSRFTCMLRRLKAPTPGKNGLNRSLIRINCLAFLPRLKAKSSFVQGSLKGNKKRRPASGAS